MRWRIASSSIATLRLAPGVAVRGEARLETGEPVAGVTVVAGLPIVAGGTAVDYWLHRTRPGSGGPGPGDRCRRQRRRVLGCDHHRALGAFDDLDRRRSTVKVELPGHGYAESDVDLREGMEETLTFRLSRQP